MVHLIAVRFVPGVAPAIDLALGAVTAGVCLAIASPLWSRVRVRGPMLRVRFGWLARTDVPLSDIVDVAVVAGAAVPEQGIAVADGVLSLILDPEGEAVRLTLAAPVAARFQVVRAVSVHTLVIGMADAAQTRAAIAQEARDAASGRDVTN